MRSTRKIRDRREPDKTPLIDVVFLLLIFFFVSLATASFVDVSEHNAPKRKAPLDWLAEVPNAPDMMDSTFYLVQVRQVSEMIGYDFALVNSVLGRLDQNGIDDFLEGRRSFAEETDIGDYAVFVCDGCGDVETASVNRAAWINSQLDEAQSQSWPLGELRDKIASATLFLPYHLPGESDGTIDDAEYRRVINVLRARLADANEDRDVHLRLADSVYFKFIFEMLTFFQEADIPARYLNFRVLSRKQ